MVGAFKRLGIAPATVDDVTIEFGEWLPDMPELDNPGALEAMNVIPSESVYIPFKNIELADTPQFPDVVRGALSIRDSEDTVYVFGATRYGIYVARNVSLTQRYVTPAPLSTELVWQFIPFGKSVVAIHPQSPTLVGDVGGFSGFSPLLGNPPTATCGARVGGFLVLGNLDNEADPNGARWPSRIRWSAFDNIEAPWVTNPATQSDFQDMPSEGGPVVAITGREVGTIFQAKSISRMQYVGLPSVFDITTVEEERGALSAGAVVDIGAMIFFICDEGFFVWNGTNSVPIGDNKVNRYFHRRLNYALRTRIIGAVDYVNSCVMWAFPTDDSPALGEIIIYSYKENRWSHSDYPVEWLLNSATFDISLDAFPDNPPIGLDYDSPSLDSAIYRGGRPNLAGFDSEHQYGLFTGVNRAVTIDTGEFTAPGGRRVFASKARPLINVSSPAVSVRPIGRDQFMGGALVYGDVSAQEIDGTNPFLADFRYMRFRTTVAQGVEWSQARGVAIARKPSGQF